jgi:ELWxxDGT repeat protein
LRSNQTCCQPDLWTTDGTTGGTIQIDSNEGFPFHLQPSSLRAFGSSIALLTDAENTGSELSVIDTTTNALTILDIAPGPGSGASDGSTIAAMDGFILYLRGNANNGLQLWRSDGTLAGTAMLQDLGTGVQLSQLSTNYIVTRVGDRVIFQSENAQNGPQLWGSDGTAAGTVPLISTPTPSSYNQPLIGVVGSHAYYAVYNGTNYQIVVSDGTVSGTHVLSDLGPLAVNGDPNGLINTQVAGDDNLTFLYAYRPDSGTGSTKHLWAYLPQTNVATHLVDATLIDMSEPPLAFAGHLYFKGSDPINADQPWVSDGTVAGTHILLIGTANIPPVASNDSASTASGAPVTINVLANDTDSDGSIDTTSVQIVSQPAHGTASVTSSGSIVYTPTAGYSGSDSFTYSEKDNQGAASNAATVTIAVSASSAPSTGGGSGGGGGGASLIDLLALGGLLVLQKSSRLKSNGMRTHVRSAVQSGQVRVDLSYHSGTFTDPGRHALHRPAPYVSDRKDTGAAGPQRQLQIVPGCDETLAVQTDPPIEPLRVRVSADEQEHVLCVDSLCVAALVAGHIDALKGALCAARQSCHGSADS